jgi:phage-related protein
MSLKEVKWLGDSRDVISGFPEDVRGELGYELETLQRGEIPAKSRPMKSIGRGVFELKEQDEAGWYRVIYIVVTDYIYVLHCFKKQSAKTSIEDLKVARRRLKQI